VVDLWPPGSGLVQSEAPAPALVSMLLLPPLPSVGPGAPLADAVEPVREVVAVVAVGLPVLDDAVGHLCLRPVAPDPSASSAPLPTAMATTCTAVTLGGAPAWPRSCGADSNFPGPCVDVLGAPQAQAAAHAGGVRPDVAGVPPLSGCVDWAPLGHCALGRALHLAHSQLFHHPRLAAATARCLAAFDAYRWGHAMATSAEGRAGVEERWYRDKQALQGSTGAP
jgi:hypothetical protein